MNEEQTPPQYPPEKTHELYNELKEIRPPKESALKRFGKRLLHVFPSNDHAKEHAASTPEALPTAVFVKQLDSVRSQLEQIHEHLYVGGLSQEPQFKDVVNEYQDARELFETCQSAAYNNRPITPELVGDLNAAKMSADKILIALREQEL